MSTKVEVTMHIPHERILHDGFSAVMRDTTLLPGGDVVLDYEFIGPGVKGGERIGVWKLIEH